MKTLGTGAAVLDILFQIGSDRTIVCDFGTDITSWSFEFIILTNKGARKKIISLTFANGGITYPIYESNQIQLNFNGDDTDIQEADYYYELRRTDTNIPILNGVASFSYDAPVGNITDGVLMFSNDSQTVEVNISNISSSGSSVTVANTSEAQAATDDSKFMSPLKVAQVTSRVFNVKAYGAKGDGVTDDTVGIQAAINAAFVGGGGIIYFTNGIYIIAGGLQTSIGGSNPNSQLYIPSNATGSPFSQPTLIFKGESGSIWPNFFSGPFSSGVILKSTLSSGNNSGSSVIGTCVHPGNPNGFNYTSAIFEDITILLYTNSGATYPRNGGINMNKMATVKFKNVAVGLDVGLDYSQDPTAGESFGIIGGDRNNDGPNIFESCISIGTKYGNVYGEHTSIINSFAFGCIYGHVFLPNNFITEGRVYSGACNTGILFPTGSVAGIDVTYAFTYVDLIAELENNASAASWTTPVRFLLDQGLRGRGSIKWNKGALGALTPIQPTGGQSFLNIQSIYSPVSEQFTNLGGQVINTGLVQPNRSQGAMTLYSLLSSVPSAIQFVASPANVGDFFATEEFINLNTLEKIGGRTILTYGSVNGCQILDVVGDGSGGFIVTLTQDKNKVVVGSPFYSAQFTSDAACDTAAGGSASDGAEYYNTISHKKKIKENTTWKTVTTS